MIDQGSAQRIIVTGQGFEVKELTRCDTASDPSAEERHDKFTISAVMAGSFVYQTEGSSRLMHPGSLLLGNAGAAYRCVHDRSSKSRCVSFRFSAEAFQEMAATAAGSSYSRFPTTALPAFDALIPVLVRVETMGDGAAVSALEMEELAVTVVEKVRAATSGDPAEPGLAVSARDLRRISEVLRYLEEHCDQPLLLEQLASVTGLSKYYFLRIFRGVVGISPYQYVLTLRLRRAALALLRSDSAVAAVAFEAGFGDLSTFNHRFRDVFGKSPLAFRQQYRRKHVLVAAL